MRIYFDVTYELYLKYLQHISCFNLDSRQLVSQFVKDLVCDDDDDYNKNRIIAANDYVWFSRKDNA